MRDFSRDRWLLNELHVNIGSGLKARLDGVTSLNDQFVHTRNQILKKSVVCVRRERNTAQQATAEATRAAKLEVESAKQRADKSEAALRGELQEFKKNAERKEAELREAKTEWKKESEKVRELLPDLPLKVKTNQVRLLQEQLDSLKLRLKEEVASKQAEIDDKKKDLSGLLRSLTDKQDFQKGLLSDLKNTANELGQTQQELRKEKEGVLNLDREYALSQKQCGDLAASNCRRRFKMPTR